MSRKSRFRIGLRHSLALLAIACLLLGVWRLSDDKAAVVRDILEVNGHIIFDDQGYDSLPKEMPVALSKASRNRANETISDYRGMVPGQSPRYILFNEHKCKIDDEVVAGLGLLRLDDVTGISFANTHIGDHTVALVSRLPHLAELDLRDTAITSKAAGILREMQNLKSLDVSGTSISSSEVDQLRKALPNCEVTGARPAHILHDLKVNGM